jgi:hypothetical protein
MQSPILADEGDSMSLTWQPLLSAAETGSQDIQRYELLWDEGRIPNLEDTGDAFGLNDLADIGVTLTTGQGTSYLLDKNSLEVGKHYRF